MLVTLCTPQNKKEHYLNTPGYLNIVAHHVHPVMKTVDPSTDAYFQQDNEPCYIAHIISIWFLEHDNGFTVLQQPPQSPNFNPIEKYWDVVKQELCIIDEQLTNLDKLPRRIVADAKRQKFTQAFTSKV